MNMFELMDKFPSHEHCIELLEKKRWGDKIKCAYCDSENTNTYQYKGKRCHHCNNCRKSFSVTVNTIFHDTKVPLHKWFILMSLMLNAKKGLSACQASRDLGITRITVWYMMHRVRKAMADKDTLLSGIVEMDETYIGGKPRKEARKHKDDDDNDTPLPPINKRGRGTKKECVVGMIERGGKVKAKHVNKNNLKFVDMQKLVRKNVKIDKSILITDEYKAYNRMRQFITHLSVNHQKEYVRGRIHTNTIESFWAIVKRGIVGQFHKVSSKYLYMYIDEFCWRFNNRNNDDKFDDLLMCCI